MPIEFWRFDSEPCTCLGSSWPTELVSFLPTRENLESLEKIELQLRKHLYQIGGRQIWQYFLIDWSGRVQLLLWLHPCQVVLIKSKLSKSQRASSIPPSPLPQFPHLNFCPGLHPWWTLTYKMFPLQLTFGHGLSWSNKVKQVTH